MNRIDSKFKELRRDNKKALIVYLTCAYPDIKTTERLVLELESAGTDIIELGVPFSDPLADGPIIQEACAYALSKGINLKKIFSLVKNIRKKSQIPICLMGYYNPVFSYNEERFVKEAKSSGADGVIIPDLPPEEARGLILPAQREDFKTIFFLSPTSSLERIKYIVKVSSGFIYYVSLTGVTGVRKSLAADIARNIKVIKSHTAKPVCVGFGISQKQHIDEVFKAADGAVIGSAIINFIKNNINDKRLAEKTGSFVKKFTGD